MKTRLLITALAIAVCALVYALSVSPSMAVSPASGAAAVTYGSSMLGGQPVGDVIVNGQTVLRIRTAAGGYSPPERARMVADRLQEMMNEGLRPQDIGVGRLNGEDVVMARGQAIVTADDRHAALNGTTPRLLASQWAGNLENVMSGRSIGAVSRASESTPSGYGTAPVETPVSQKIVPIISIGQGLRVGAAVVAGPNYMLDQVKAVAQLDGQFAGSVRVRVLVPVSTENVVSNIQRVPETSVIGLADIKL